VFQLSLPVTLSTLDITKLALTKALPDVKSSHRSEAMARGFGFGSHAAFRAAAKSGDGKIAMLDGSAFHDYLAKHDFNVKGSALYRAGAKAALQAVAERFPSLTKSGFGAGDWDPRKTPAERRKMYAEDRAALTSDYAVAPFLASLAFVSRAVRTKTIRPATNSYWLKHIVEEYHCTYPDGEALGPVYVANGLLIAAAVHAGFEVKPHRDEYGRETLNAGFNMAKVSLYDLDCEIRPDGSRANARRDLARQRAARRSGYVVY
jgi:hypothetical protein